MVCKNCGQQNAPTDVFCTHCGTLLAVNANERIVADCPVCNLENDITDKYCFRCGSSLKKASVRKISVGPAVSVPVQQAVAVPVQQEASVAESEESRPVMSKTLFEPVSYAQPVVETPVAETVQADYPETEEDAFAAFTPSVKKPRVSCPHCGAKNDADAMYCRDCAQSMTIPKRKKLADIPDGDFEEKKIKKSSKKKASVPALLLKKVLQGKKKTPTTKKTKRTTKKQKSLPVKNLAMIAVVLIAAVLVIFAGASIADSGNSDFIYDKHDFRFDFSAGTGSFSLFVNGESVGSLPAKDVPVTVYYDLNNTCGVFALPVQENGAAATAVYYFDKNGMTRLLDNVNSVIYLSAEGTAMLYIDSKAALSLYNIEEQTNVTIAENGKYVSGAYAISPDGEYVMYCFRNDSKTNTVCAYSNGEHKEICTSGVPVAITNGGKQVYYLTVLNNTYDFYSTSFKKPAKFNKIASSVYASSIKLNQDMSEILFSLIDGSTYYSKAGKQAERITAASLYPVMCNVVNFKNCSGIATVYGMQDFFDSFWIGERGLYVALKGHEPRMLVANMLDYDISTDGQTLTYADADGKLYIRNLKTIEDDAAALAENVTAVSVTGNGESVYYINSVLALCSVNDAGESILIDQNVDGIKCSEKSVFYKSVSRTQEYAVSICSNGKEGKLISNSVQSFLISDGCVYYTSGDGQHLYYSKNGTRNFKQLY